jgi:septum formation inhibitor MinC
VNDSVDEGTGLSGPLPDEDTIFFNESSRLVTARGTEDGLVLRLDGKSEWPELLPEVRKFIDARRRFLLGAEVSIEWLERLPTPEQADELSRCLQEEFSISIVGRKRKSGAKPPSKGSPEREKGDRGKREKRSQGTIPLFDAAGAALPGLSSPGNHEVRSMGLGKRIETELVQNKRPPTDIFEADLGLPARRSISGGMPVDRMSKMLTDEIAFDEDANAKILFGTLRSGQKVETPFSLIVCGDVNPGADLIAGGDIIVLGNLRGTAHAAAYDDDGQDRIIFALQMQPMQLRIGSVISRGSDESGQGPEVARIENRRIIVETYHPRGPRRGR